MKEDFTQSRNRIIARIFRVIKLAENAGTGFEKMFSGWRNYYKQDPIVTGDMDFYKIEFPLSALKSSVKSLVKIMELIKQNNSISIPEIAQEIRLTTRAVEKQIAKLKTEGKLKRIGSAKGGCWKRKSIKD